MTSLAVGLCVVGGLTILGNFYLPLRYARQGQNVSLIPVMGGLMTCIGMLIYPGGAWSGWAWAPLVLDLGCAFLVVCLLYGAIRG